MTHTERRRLIHAPFSFQVIPPKTHAGVLIDREGTRQGGRTRPHPAGDPSGQEGARLTDLEDIIAFLED